MFDLKDQAPAAPAPVVAPPPKRQKPAIDENRIEDELAELKKRLGR